MAIDKLKIDYMIGLIRKNFPNWNDFNDKDFIRAEREYKVKAIEIAQELFSEQKLRILVKKGKYDEIFKDIRKIAVVMKNLLFLKIPRAGDLNILENRKLNKPEFCDKFYDLLYGNGFTQERLNRFILYLRNNELPHKLNFATFYLFVTNPRDEIFLKTNAQKWFLRLIGDEDALEKRINDPVLTFIRFKEHCKKLFNELRDRKPQDMTDIQSFIWVSYETDKGKYKVGIKKDKKGSNEKRVSYTGYWTFINQPKTWPFDKYMDGKKVDSDIYPKSMWYVGRYLKDFKIGDWVLLRICPDKRNKDELGGKERLEPGVYAIAKITKSISPRDMASKSKSKKPLEIEFVNCFLNTPILIDQIKSNPVLKQDKYLVSPHQISAIPLREDAFREICSLVGFEYDEEPDIEPTEKEQSDFDSKILKDAKINSPEEAKKLIVQISKELKNKPVEVRTKIAKMLSRNPKLAKLVKESAGYVCQVCKADPFIKKNGGLYAEAHHINELAKTKIDNPESMLCVCPTCHRVMHYGNEDAKKKRESLKNLRIDDAS